MWRDRLFRTGVLGSMAAAVCCFTPMLVWALAALGLSAAVAWLDLVLLPALAAFLALTFYALIRHLRQKRSRP